ncbi:hypothetical protein [Geobacter sulfurreducens]|uniref:hypothetical protein n=1 Tax=Geobacter sulfurreducens TaxID=35554 RepID=UPI000DBAE916|nr:hypothetical protein [Geobacter sulfurreducens]BBA69301.1 hypothetical protein YM18_0753 [Geobacter sulfurreducens]
MERIFKSWSGLASHFIGECFDVAKPFIDERYSGLDPLIRFVAAQLYIDCHLSSESILLLIREQKEWDTDLVARSVMEGSLKFTYMLQGEPPDIGRKVDEYWNILPQFASIKHSERAVRFLQEVPDPDNPNWLPFKELILDEPMITAIRSKYSRQERQSLEESWSFTGICRAFAKSDNLGLKLFANLAHGYGMSSHLIHKDADGIGMVWDRFRRDPERQTAVKLGHSARVVSDVCTFAKLRLFSLLRACQQPTDSIGTIEQRYQELLFDELAKAGKQFTDIEYSLHGQPG